MQVFCPILILGLVTLPVPVRIVGVPNREKKQEIKKSRPLFQAGANTNRNIG